MKITRASDTIELSASNGGQGCGQGSGTVIGCHQGHGEQGGHFNRPAYTSSIKNLKGEVDDFSTLLGTLVKQ